MEQHLQSDQGARTPVRPAGGPAGHGGHGPTKRGLAGGGLPGRGIVESIGDLNAHVRFGVELLLGWLVVSLVVWAVLAFTVAVAPPGGSALEPSSYEIWQPDLTDDPIETQPDGPLVFCEVFATHTRCIREAS